MTLLFDRNNWFMPQTITVFAYRRRRSPRARASSPIQHIVVQGASPDDGGAYDGLAAPGVIVAGRRRRHAERSCFVPVGDSTLLVSENATGALPKTDSLPAARSRTPPNGPVTFRVQADGQTRISTTANGTYVQTLDLEFARRDARR